MVKIKAFAIGALGETNDRIDYRQKTRGSTVGARR
jgi:hypothetical protein